ncbi:MAG TPA: flagellar hook-associated protein FlgL [Acidobacteriota bacterium]|nr:flagellar hook-associated protein FlgL [Acidobacteriota bacterium]
MRITNGMMASQVVFNMQRSLRRFTDMQTNMSSGRRINKPSDDPLGTLRDLGYRTELAKIAQYSKNVTQGLTWMTTYDSVLADVKDIVSSAKEVAIAMANGNYDAAAREASAQEIRSMIEQLVQLANTELEGRRVFSGFRTKVTPFEVSGNGVLYRGDRGEIQFDVESSSLMTINLDGASAFLERLCILGEDADLQVGVTGQTLLADLHNGNGIDQGSFTITDRNLDFLPVATVDISGATTVDDVLTLINAELTASGITNLVARLGDEGNNITLEATENGLISNSTLLSDLNEGKGIDLEPGTIQLTDSGGIGVQVNLSGAETIGDVITQFNAQLAAAGVANVTMAVNAANTGLVITDTNGVPLGLTITDVDVDNHTASGLGIVGAVDPTLDGDDLNPVTRFEVAENGGTTAGDLCVLGEFPGTRVGEDLDPGLQVTDLLTSLNNRLGAGLGSFTVYQGGSTHTVDVTDPALVTVQDLLDELNNSGLDITASINASGRGIQVVNNDTTRSFSIEEDGDGRTAKTLQLFGSSDLLGSMLTLRNALEKDDQEGTGMLLQNLDDGLLQLLKQRATIGARTIRLEATDRRLLDLNLNFTDLLSKTEDADISKLVTDLTTYENNYRAALISAGKIVQPSLLDFLS